MTKELNNKDFKTFLKLLNNMKDIFKEVSEDKNNNFLKRKQASLSFKSTEELLNKFEKIYETK